MLRLAPPPGTWLSWSSGTPVVGSPGDLPGSGLKNLAPIHLMAQSPCFSPQERFPLQSSFSPAPTPELLSSLGKIPQRDHKPLQIQTPALLPGSFQLPLGCGVLLKWRCHRLPIFLRVSSQVPHSQLKTSLHLPQTLQRNPQLPPSPLLSVFHLLPSTWVMWQLAPPPHPPLPEVGLPSRCRPPHAAPAPLLSSPILRQPQPGHSHSLLCLGL